MRPEWLDGLRAKSVRKKMQQASLAASVSRNDIARGAEELGVELDEHIEFCARAMQGIAAEVAV